MEATSAIIDCAWIHYKIKIKKQDALHILLDFVNRLVADKSWFEDLHGCMKESMEDYLLLTEQSTNVHWN
jgi:hypothetical protein